MQTVDKNITKVVYVSGCQAYIVFVAHRYFETVLPEDVFRWTEIFRLVQYWPMALNKTLQEYTPPAQEGK